MNLEELKEKATNLANSATLAGAFWNEKRQLLRQNLINTDPANFLSWSEVGVTMFLGNWPFVQTEYEALVKYRPNWLEVMQEDSLGSPEIYPNTNTSANLIHQAYHLLRWEQQTNQKITQVKSILEIGGGYGAMAKLLQRLGFTGNYLIYDLPEVALLQQYYLSQVIPNKITNIKWVTFDTLPHKVDLFMSMWALSEMPEAIRYDLLFSCKPNNYLIGYQKYFEGIDNEQFFKDLQLTNPGKYKWENKKIDHHPGDSWYLFGGVTSK